MTRTPELPTPDDPPGADRELSDDEIKAMVEEAWREQQGEAES